MLRFRDWPAVGDTPNMHSAPLTVQTLSSLMMSESYSGTNVVRWIWYVAAEM